MTALDATVNGSGRLRTRAARKHLPVDRMMVNFNEIRTPLVVAAELARLPEERHLHARFLLDALSGQARLGSPALRGRDAAHRLRSDVPAVLQHRPRAGECTAYPAHFRQHLDPEDVVAEAPAGTGGTVVEREQGQGWPSCATEDPDVCRLVVGVGRSHGETAAPRPAHADIRGAGERPGARGPSGSAAATSASTTCSRW